MTRIFPYWWAIIRGLFSDGVLCLRYAVNKKTQPVVVEFFGFALDYRGSSRERDIISYRYIARVTPKWLNARYRCTPLLGSYYSGIFSGEVLCLRNAANKKTQPVVVEFFGFALDYRVLIRERDIFSYQYIARVTPKWLNARYRGDLIV